MKYWDGTQWAYAVIGAQGPQGVTGPTGPAGANGATGPTGPQGIQGATGPAGVDGVAGATGPTGPQGAQAVTSQAVSTNITLAEGIRYLVDTSAARTLTLPASPALGAQIEILDASGTAATNNITVNNNSQKINGVLDTALLDTNGVAVAFIYTGATYGWRLG